MWNDGEKSKQTTFNVGDTVRKKDNGIFGIVEKSNEHGDRLRVLFQKEDSFWIDSYAIELVRTKKVTNIRSIKSLYTKAANNPSSNHAEEKAIVFFDKLVDYGIRRECIVSVNPTFDYDEKFNKLLSEYEKRALQYYRKIRL